MPKRKSGSLLHVKMPKNEPLFLFAIFILNSLSKLSARFFSSISSKFFSRLRLGMFFRPAEFSRRFRRIILREFNEEVYILIQYSLYFNISYRLHSSIYFKVLLIERFLSISNERGRLKSYMYDNFLSHFDGTHFGSSREYGLFFPILILK